MKHKLKYIILGQDKNGNSIDVPEPNFESINISNGVYYLQLQTINQTITNKMIILK